MDTNHWVHHLSQSRTFVFERRCHNTIKEKKWTSIPRSMQHSVLISQTGEPEKRHLNLEADMCLCFFCVAGKVGDNPRLLSPLEMDWNKWNLLVGRCAWWADIIIIISLSTKRSAIPFNYYQGLHCHFAMCVVDVLGFYAEMDPASWKDFAMNRWENNKYVEKAKRETHLAKI